MKYCLTMLGNIIIFILWMCIMIVLVLWYGKLPKVSPYHLWKYEISPTQTFCDETIQGRHSYPKDVEKHIFHKKLNELMESSPRCKHELREWVNILGDDGKPMGKQTLYALISSELQNLS